MIVIVYLAVFFFQIKIFWDMAVKVFRGWGAWQGDISQDAPVRHCRRMQ